MQHQKAALRIKYLPEKAMVLDLFCGTGEMYRAAYKDRAGNYQGVDKKQIHDPAICVLMNNEAFIAQRNIDTYNVFDLDAYGTPWKQMYLLLRKLKRSDAVLFVTDGLVMHQKVDGDVTKFVSATERVNSDLNVPGLNRFYVQIFATMLLDIESRYGWKTQKAVYFHNERRSVYYWYLKMSKSEEGQEKQG